MRLTPKISLPGVILSLFLVGGALWFLTSGMLSEIVPAADAFFLGVRCGNVLAGVAFLFPFLVVYMLFNG